MECECIFVMLVPIFVRQIQGNPASTMDVAHQSKFAYIGQEMEWNEAR